MGSFKYIYRFASCIECLFAITEFDIARSNFLIATRNMDNFFFEFKHLARFLEADNCFGIVLKFALCATNEVHIVSGADIVAINQMLL
jgi:hypothetical protein